MIKKHLVYPAASLILVIFTQLALAEPVPYKIDTKGAHAFIQFKIKHLGYSWLYGRFNTFDGSAMLDEDAMENSSIRVTIDMASLDTNHAERDKHLRGKDFFEVSDYPEATFESTHITSGKDNALTITGNLTLHGVTKEITIRGAHVGGGPDPWGGYRHGFTGTTTLRLKDFEINRDLGPASTEAEVMLDVELVKQ